MKNKRGIAWSFLVMLVIGVILFILVTSWTSSLFRLSDQGLESFNHLANTVENVAKGSGEVLETINLRLDRGTVLAVFPKDTTQLTLHITDAVLKIQMDRPAKCETGKPCICLCQEPGWDNTHPTLYNIPCNNNFCRSFEQPTGKTFDFKKEQRHDRSYWEGGLFMLRQNKATFSHALKTYFNTDLPRMNEVSVHKLNNEIDIFLVKETTN
jgi:hypothetical protein